MLLEKINCRIRSITSWDDIEEFFEETLKNKKYGLILSLFWEWLIVVLNQYEWIEVSEENKRTESLENPLVMQKLTESFTIYFCGKADRRYKFNNGIKDSHLKIEDANFKMNISGDIYEFTSWRGLYRWNPNEMKWEDPRFRDEENYSYRHEYDSQRIAELDSLIESTILLENHCNVFNEIYLQGINEHSDEVWSEDDCLFYYEARYLEWYYYCGFTEADFRVSIGRNSAPKLDSLLSVPQKKVKKYLKRIQKVYGNVNKLYKFSALELLEKINIKEFSEDFNKCDNAICWFLYDNQVITATEATILYKHYFYDYTIGDLNRKVFPSEEQCEVIRKRAIRKIRKYYKNYGGKKRNYETRNFWEGEILIALLVGKLDLGIIERCNSHEFKEKYLSKLNLDKKYNNVFELYYFHSIYEAEIADILNIAIKEIKTCLDIVADKLRLIV